MAWCLEIVRDHLGPSLILVEIRGTHFALRTAPLAGLGVTLVGPVRAPVPAIVDCQQN